MLFNSTVKISKHRIHTYSVKGGSVRDLTIINRPTAVDHVKSGNPVRHIGRL